MHHRANPTLLGLAVLFLAGPTPLLRSQGSPFPSFPDVSAEVGVDLGNVSGGATKDYILESLGNGAAFLDYDGDGDVDLAITNGSPLETVSEAGASIVALYENRQGRFRDVSRDAGLLNPGWGVGICAADYDNDGHQDFYVTAYGGNVLYRNTGQGGFEDRSLQAGVADPGWSTGCAFADYDRDGDVDLYVANYVRFDRSRIPRRGESARCSYMGVAVFCGPLDLPGAGDTLYRNNGDGTFSDATGEAGVEGPEYYGLGVLFSDFDNDGWPDIYVANDAVPNLLFRNDGDGTFSDASLISGTALSEKGAVQSGMGVAAGDYDRDGDFDIFVTNFARDTNTLYRNMGDLFFVDVTASVGMEEVSRSYLGWGTGFADLDNDGLEDIFVANGHVYPEVDGLDIGQSYRQPKEVYRNLGDGGFEETAARLEGDLLDAQPARGAAFGDYDNDGDLDVVVVNIDEVPSLYRNDGGNRNNWVSFRLEGTQSNRAAIGARVEIDVDGTTRVGEVRSGGSYLSHDDPRIHFGLGQARRIDEVRIEWPSGHAEVVRDLGVNRFWRLIEGGGIRPVDP